MDGETEDETNEGEANPAESTEPEEKPALAPNAAKGDGSARDEAATATTEDPAAAKMEAAAAADTAPAAVGSTNEEAASHDGTAHSAKDKKRGGSISGPSSGAHVKQPSKQSPRLRDQAAKQP